ncbi:hypothetical protein DPMN_191279 [Dreissena polymorpha]|uniref:Uncharacterized protein n=1 Tax=Dreissena polymorpha TaxID=45954 RepID=A0A9D3Y2I8_DREPO|nr:hypothetical protein DPMN_191279 [Dreissena polymorpha]
MLCWQYNPTTENVTLAVQTPNDNSKCYAGGTNSLRFIITQTDNSLKMLRQRYKLPKVHNHTDRYLKMLLYNDKMLRRRYKLCIITDRYFFENVTLAVQTLQ